MTGIPNERFRALRRALLCALTGVLCAARLPAAERVLPASAVTNGLAPLTLAAAYQQALAHMETVRIAESEWRAAEERYRRAGARRWPEARAVAEGVQRDASGDDDHDYGIGLSGSWDVFTGFRTSRDREARFADSEALRFDLARTRQLLYQDVADVFYQALSFERELRAVAAQQRALEEQVAETERRLALGRSRKGDLLFAQTQLAQTRVTAEELRTLQSAALEVLAFLTGTPAAGLHPVENSPLPAIDDVNRALADRGARPDVSAASARADAARLDVKAVRADRAPHVTADGNIYAWRDPDDGTWDVGIRAELPVFDGGGRRAAVAEQVEIASAREWSLAALRRSADSDVRAAVIEFSGALAQWNALREAVVSAGKNVELQQKDNAIGRVATLDVLIALAQSLNLNRQEAALEMRMRAALVHLQVAAGAVREAP